MRLFHLESMIGGWFVGAFAPSAYQTAAAEVAAKHYPAGTTDARHYHQRATEITLVLEGSASFDDRVCGAGEIVVLDPGEAVEFRALKDTVLIVVKVPSVPGDKFPGAP